MTNLQEFPVSADEKFIDVETGEVIKSDIDLELELADLSIDEIDGATEVKSISASSDGLEDLLDEDVPFDIDEFANDAASFAELEEELNALTAGAEIQSDDEFEAEMAALEAEEKARQVLEQIAQRPVVDSYEEQDVPEEDIGLAPTQSDGKEKQSEEEYEGLKEMLEEVEGEPEGEHEEDFDKMGALDIFNALQASHPTPVPKAKAARAKTATPRSTTPRAMLTAEEREAALAARMPDYYLLEKSDLALSLEEQKEKHSEMIEIIGNMKKKVGLKAENYIRSISNGGGEMSVFLAIATRYIVNNPDDIHNEGLKAHFMAGHKNGSMSYTAGTATPQAANCMSLFKTFKMIVNNGGKWELNPESVMLERAKTKLGL